MKDIVGSRIDAIVDAGRPVARKAGSVVRHKATKTAVSVGLIAWLISLLEWEPLITALGRCDLRLLALVQVIVALLIVVSAVKWRMLLELKGRTPSLGRLTRVYYMATFFNNFFPTNIGGDTIRVLNSSDPQEASGRDGDEEGDWGWEDATAAIVVERVTGLLALLAICCLGAAIGLAVGPTLPLFRWIAVAGAVGAPLAWFLGTRALRVVSERSPEAELPLPGWLERVVRSCAAYSVADRSFLPVWAISFAFQLATVGMVWILAHAVSVEIGVVPLLVIVPLRSLAMMLPISLNGIGVGESAYVVLLAPFGVDPEPAFLMGLLARVMVTIVSIVGGVVYATSRGSAVIHRTSPGTAPTSGVG